MACNPVTKKWLDNLPPNDTMFLPASAKPVQTAEIYHGWLRWLREEASLLLAHLDHVESRYRRIGLQYHRVPRALRITPTQPHSNQINLTVLNRLAEIFECDASRPNQSFFDHWYKASTCVELIIQDIRAAEQITNVDDLKRIYTTGEAHLKKGNKYIREINIGMEALEKMFQEVHVRLHQKRVDDTIADLDQRHGLEGMLFRGWICTFPEIGVEEIGKKVALVEEIAEDYWCGVGVRKGTWWSGDKKEDNSAGERMAEGLGRLGEEWLNLRKDWKD